MTKISIIFFGTGDFATVILQGLINNPLVKVELVITQPDKPVGRKQELQLPPVKLLAQKHGLQIEQPEKLQRSLVGANLLGMTKKIDLNIVVDYGLLIPQNIIDIPKHGSINIHPSLLPLYRGPSPIQSVLINGESQTGVSIMLIDAKMDHGPILAQKTLNIEPDDTYTTLHAKAAKMASEMLLNTIPAYVDGKISPKPQDDKKATFCKILKREDGLVDFNKTAQEIYNQYRGLTPWPGIYIEVKNQRLKLLRIKPSEAKIENKIVVYKDEKIFIGCNSGCIEILELQMEGKKPMKAKDFINGYKQLNNFKL